MRPVETAACSATRDKVYEKVIDVKVGDDGLVRVVMLGVLVL